ncbi:MAG: pyrroline-5-carboxylate reductase [Oscillospiraceae bacterium]|jgi:pyrroline-5-carboxylate reductase|nr:pyrroline-5-carboxylate reductase [Oscillospiraceae bacterium]
MILGFLGVGVMAGAILRAVVREGFVPPEDCLVYDIVPAAMEAVRPLGVRLAGSAADVAAAADVLQLGTKPQDIEALLRAIGPALADRDPLILSIAAGKSLETLAAALPYAPRLARLVPNVNATVGESITAYCPNERARDAETPAFLARYCGCFGRAVPLEEKQVPAFFALAGAGPAYAYLFLDEIARAGVALGLRKDLALEIAAQMVLGSAKKVQAGEAHPYALIDQVCSPGGITIAGLEALREHGFITAVDKAFRAVVRRDKELG